MLFNHQAALLKEMYPAQQTQQDQINMRILAALERIEQRLNVTA